MVTRAVASDLGTVEVITQPVDFDQLKAQLGQLQAYPPPRTGSEPSFLYAKLRAAVEGSRASVAMVWGESRDPSGPSYWLLWSWRIIGARARVPGLSRQC